MGIRFNPAPPDPAAFGPQQPPPPGGAQPDPPGEDNAEPAVGTVPDAVGAGAPTTTSATPPTRETPPNEPPDEDANGDDPNLDVPFRSPQSVADGTTLYGTNLDILA